MTIQDQTSRLRRAYVRPPIASDLRSWRAFGWHRQPDPDRAIDEHAAFRLELERFGTDVVVGRSPAPGDPDAIYAYDPVLMTDDGAIPLLPGKAGRRSEPDSVAADLEGAGVRVRERLSGAAVAEGGDMIWLDPSTLLVGRGYRTNDEGIAQLRAVLGSAIEVVAFDLPHHGGPDECLHLMSFISPLDVDLAVAFTPMMPVRLVEILRARAISIVDVPEEELATMGPNVLALGPRVALALDGNPRTRRRMESAGVDVRTYTGSEISANGDGGPTCLTCPIERG